MRHAEGVRQHGAKPLAHAFTLAQGVGGWGVAPSARSTPTLWAYAQRNAHKDTPKKTLKLKSYILNFELVKYSLTLHKLTVITISL
ncbi:MAG: hypothetical protein NZ455_04485 [Bacteroidia bacterium]|nr:hypothetical protein [Bacteroidia bacterium]